MSVRKALVLAAGYGTRLLPATKAQPKEALPLVDKPIIQYTVEEAAAAGLEQALLAKGEHARLDEVRHISDLADIVYVRQKEQRGIGDAVLTARGVIGDEPFVLFFPDDVILSDVPAAVTMTIWVIPAAAASSTTYWMIGLSTSGRASFGWALVAGSRRVP